MTPGGSGEAVVVGDFNGDGNLDLAVSCESFVSVLLGNGNGTFQAHLDSGTGGTALAAGDFNGDGKLDLVTSGGTSGTLAVLLGNGDGTFVTNATYAVGGSSIAAVDLNGDGKMDVVVSSGDDSNSVSVLLGNGNGTLQTPVRYGTGVLPLGVIVADLNGDGKLDVAAADSVSSISILLGFGDGTFVGETEYTLDSTASITNADFRNDGNLDLAAAAGLEALVFLGNGTGTFQPQTAYAAGTGTVGIAAGQLRTASSNVDLITANNPCGDTGGCNPGTVSVLLGNGDGTFQPHVDYLAGLAPVSVTLAGFRNNGKTDLAVANFSGSSVSVLLGNGDGTFQPQVSYLTASNPNQIAVGSFGLSSGDGNLDMAVAANSAVSILLGNGDGTFQPHVDYPVVGLSIVSADFNGDGKEDLAVGGYTGVAILLGNGDGTFQPAVTYPTGDSAFVYSLSVTDFNQDGKLDLVASTGAGAAILLGNGDGTFQFGIDYVLANGSQNSVTLGDFNRDGAPDWAASGEEGSNGVMVSAAFKGISPSSLNFGSQGVGTTSSAQTITIRNPTNVAISIASISSSGSFSETNNCGASLGLGAICSVNVTFSPTTTGSHSGSITITDNTRISPLSIALSGSGVSGAFLAANPARLDLSPQAVGTSGASSPIVLVNTGNASLNITGISVTGSNSSDFTQTNNCGSSLPAAGSCTVNVTFAPTAAGSRTATLSVANSASGGPLSATLVGVGLGPISNLNPRSLTYASQAVGTTSNSQIVNLTNVGSTPLNITGIAASGDFAETNTCGASLAAGGTCQISVIFAPTATGTRTGSITVSDNASGSPQTITLSGVATAAPDFTVSPASGSPTSQTVTAGQSASFSLAIASGGSFNGTVNLSCAITPAMTQAPICSLSSSSVQIASGGSQPVTATVGTTAPVTSHTTPYINFPAGPMQWTWTLILLGSGCLLLRTRKQLPALAAPAMMLALLLCVGCGGSSSPSTTTHTSPGTPAGTYTATVTATSGSVTQTMALQVVVQ